MTYEGACEQLHFETEFEVDGERGGKRSVCIGWACAASCICGGTTAAAGTACFIQSSEVSAECVSVALGDPAERLVIADRRDRERPNSPTPDKRQKKSMGYGPGRGVQGRRVGPSRRIDGRRRRATRNPKTYFKN